MQKVQPGDGQSIKATNSLRGNSAAVTGAGQSRLSQRVPNLEEVARLIHLGSHKLKASTCATQAHLSVVGSMTHPPSHTQLPSLQPPD